MGTEVVVVMATSMDEGVNADITYSIIGGNERRKFEIGPISGLVKVAGEVDHERAKEYFLTIQARDGGDPPLSNHASVNITIMDINDNSPVFVRPSYTESVSEMAAIGTEVGKVTATDMDKKINGIVTYRLVHGDPQGQWRVEEATGRVLVAAALDREMISSYGETNKRHGKSIFLFKKQRIISIPW